MAQPTIYTAFDSDQQDIRFNRDVLGYGQAKNPIMPWLRTEGKGGGSRSIGTKLLNANEAGEARLDAISPATGGALPDNVRAKENMEKLYWYVNKVGRTRFRKSFVTLLSEEMVTGRHDITDKHRDAAASWYAWWSTLYMTSRMSCGQETIDSTPAGATDADKITAYEAQMTGMTVFEVVANQALLGRAGCADDYKHINAVFAHDTQGIDPAPPEGSWDTMSETNLVTPFSIRRAAMYAVAAGLDPLNGVIEDMEDDIPSFVWFCGLNGYQQLVNHAELIEYEKHAEVRGPDNPYFKGRKVRKFVYQNQIFIPIFFSQAAEDLTNLTTIRTEDTNDGLVKEEWLVCGQNSLLYAAPMWFRMKKENDDFDNEKGLCLDTMEGLKVARKVRSNNTTRNQIMSFFCTATKITR